MRGARFSWVTSERQKYLMASSSCELSFRMFRLRSKHNFFFSCVCKRSEGTSGELHLRILHSFRQLWRGCEEAEAPSSGGVRWLGAWPEEPPPLSRGLMGDLLGWPDRFSPRHLWLGRLGSQLPARRHHGEAFLSPCRENELEILNVHVGE